MDEMQARRLSRSRRNGSRRISNSASRNTAISRVKGIEFELRHALEPWHVMGEEGAAGGTVRYVDSSVERVQVKVRGMAPDRYVLTCNGVPVPLQTTGTNRRIRRRRALSRLAAADRACIRPSACMRR